MQNQSELQKYRKKIDKIDEKILKLLAQRMDIVEDVAQFKTKNGEKFFIRSSREFEMIHDLIKKSDKRFPASVIVDIWRRIITSANILEQKIKIGIFNPRQIPDYFYILQQYYGDFVEIINYAEIAKLCKDVEKNKIQIVALNTEDNWISEISKSKIKIFAKAPFLKNSKHELFLAAIKEAEKSKSDNSLFVVQKSELDKFKGKILKKNGDFCLIEIAGFLANKPNFIGNYPTLKKSSSYS